MALQRARARAPEVEPAPEAERAAGPSIAPTADANGPGDPDATPSLDLAGSALPFADELQSSFGAFDVGGIAFHGGEDAAREAEGVGARAFASGEDVVAGEALDRHDVAHEAAHVVMQRGGGAPEGVVDDPAREATADAAADAATRGGDAAAVLSEVADPAAPPATPGPVERLERLGGAGFAAVDPATLGEADVLAALTALRTADVTTWRSDAADDRARLEARLTSLRYAAIEASLPATAVAAIAPGLSTEAAARGVPIAVVQQFGVLLGQINGHAAVTSFDRWVMSNGPKMVKDGAIFDFMNELREAKIRADALVAEGQGRKLDLAEQAIPGTPATADAGIAAGGGKPAEQVEVKTVTVPITSAAGLGGQLGAGMSKFVAVPQNGDKLTVVVYASYDTSVPAPVSKNPQNTVMAVETVDPAAGTKNEKMYRHASGNPAFDPLNPLANGWALFKDTPRPLDAAIRTQILACEGSDRVDQVEIRMENGKSFTGVRAGAAWTVT